jgi:hypothetical protein
MCSLVSSPERVRLTLAPGFLYRRELEGYDVADERGSVIPGTPVTLPVVRYAWKWCWSYAVL